MIPTLPEPRGPLSEQLLASLRLPPHRFATPRVSSRDPVMMRISSSACTAAMSCTTRVCQASATIGNGSRVFSSFADAWRWHSRSTCAPRFPITGLCLRLMYRMHSRI